MNSRSRATPLPDQDVLYAAELKLAEQRYGEEEDCHRHLMDKGKMIFTVAGVPLGLGLARPSDVMSHLRSAGGTTCVIGLLTFAAMYLAFFVAMLLAIRVLTPRTRHTPADPAVVAQKLRDATPGTITRSVADSYASAARKNRDINDSLARNLSWAARLAFVGYLVAALFLTLLCRAMYLHGTPDQITQTMQRQVIPNGRSVRTESQARQGETPQPLLSQGDPTDQLDQVISLGTVEVRKSASGSQPSKESE